MESLYYSAYLLVVLFSCFLINAVAKLRVDFRRALVAIAPVFVLFVLWDIVAVHLGHWEFGMTFMLGPVIVNQPLEELGFFFVIPLFYIVAWEAVRAHLR